MGHKIQQQQSCALWQCQWNLYGLMLPPVPFLLLYKLKKQHTKLPKCQSTAFSFSLYCNEIFCFMVVINLRSFYNVKKLTMTTCLMTCTAVIGQEMCQKDLIHIYFPFHFWGYYQLFTFFAWCKYGKLNINTVISIHSLVNDIGIKFS